MIQYLIQLHLFFGIIYGWNVDEDESGNTLLKKILLWEYYFIKDVKIWWKAHE